MADVDRDPIHEKLLTLVELIPRCNMDNRLDLMVFLINVAKKSGHVRRMLTLLFSDTMLWLFLHLYVHLQLCVHVFAVSPQSIKSEHLMVLKQLYVHPEMLSYSCELFTALSSHNPQVIVECKQLVYSMAHSNEKYAANTAMILTQVAISVNVGYSVNCGKN